MFWSFWFKRQGVCDGGKTPRKVVPKIQYNVKAPRVASFIFKLYIIMTAYMCVGRYFLVPTIKRICALDGLYIDLPKEP